MQKAVFSKIDQLGPDPQVAFIDMAMESARPISVLGACMAFVAENKSPFLIERTGDDAMGEHYRWILSLEGTGRFTTEEGSWDLPPGTLLVTPSWIPRRLEVVGDRWKRLSFTVLSNAENDILKIREVHTVQCPFTKGISDAMEHYLYEQNGLNPLRGQLMMHYGALIALYIKQGVQSISSLDDYQMYDRFGRLWNEVNRRLAHPWTVKELAEKLYISTSYLYQLCRKHYNCGPLQYVTKLRMRRAEELLLHSQHSLAYIAESIGYKTEYAFSAAFYKNCKIRPGAFRKSAQNHLL